MHHIWHDWETFWSKTHSLTKMGPLKYVMHPETEIISLSLAVNDEPPETVFGEADALALLRWANVQDGYLVAHNNEGFDALITGARFGFRPKLWGCTLAMARPYHAKTTGLSLAKLVQHYGLGVKDNTVLMETQGKHLADFTADELARMKVYNGADTEQCRALFKKLAPRFTTEELWHLDCNIRMVADPAFAIDRAVLEAGASAERDGKRKATSALARLLREQYVDLVLDWGDEDAVEEFIRSEMASQPKFAALLQRQGVDVPTKPSPTDPAKFVFALAKTDEAFTEMVDHEDDLVAAAARARLAVKSTITETRIKAFLDTSADYGNKLPVTLKYCGADTTGRDSGWAYNPQNLSRINKKKPRPADCLRNSLTAPKGYLVGVADQSGIELRMSHYYWGVPRTAELYAGDPQADLYKDYASYYYDKPPEEIAADERQFAKVGLLGLQFGAGAKTFQRVARLMGGIKLSLEASEMAVAGWRKRYVEIVEGWKRCNEALTEISKGIRAEVDHRGMVVTEDDGLRLPSGRLIHYPNLRFVDEGETWPDGRSKKSWVYADGRYKTYLHGAKVVENIIQALSRDSVFECALRFFKLSRLRPIMRVHDELIYLFPQSEADDLLTSLQATMRTPPSWAPEMVLWSEGSCAPRYGQCK